MPLNLSGQLALTDDVLLIPVRELPEESLAQIDCGPDDFALSRLQARSGSKIVDPGSAALLQRFREPRTVVEAVILFSRERSLDPNEVLEGAYPLIRSLAEAGFLVPAGEDGGTAPSRAPRWSAGASLLGGVVERTVQVLDDSELYLLARAGGGHSVIKVERPLPAGAPSGPVREQLRREAAFLERLDGDGAPALLGQGEVDGRAYLELDFVAGVEATAAAAEWRERGGEDGRRVLVALLQEIAGAYAALHRRGVLHGDVHPRNVLVGRDGGVWLIDFGVARGLDPAGGLPQPADRGGVPFFFEPELARAYLEPSPAPPASEAGEQFALAALLYSLATGAHWRDFSLGREEMLREICGEEPLAFAERGAAPWPELEAVLRQGLAKRPEERYPSLAAFAAALAAVPATLAPSTGRAARAGQSPLDRVLAENLERAAPDGPWMTDGIAPAPTASVNYGAAGIALGLLQIAQRRGDAGLLAAADLWTRRAARAMGEEGAFYNPEIEISREMVGESSPYHSPSGIHATAALVARAQGDPMGQGEAVAAFLEAAGRPAAGLDLTLGRASTLLGAAILLDAVPAGELLDAGPLRAFGDTALAELWQALDAKPEIARSDVQYPGIAHGWAGFLYATLQWCRIAGAPVPAGVEQRLAELAALALPVGRGLQWPWVLHQPGEPATMPGWCNGSCGYVFLWTAAHRSLGDARWLDLAVLAAWDSWDAQEPIVTLCCGLAGRAYALLNLYRHTGERVWLDRARALARRAAKDGHTPAEYPHSLWKGSFGLAVLAADLEQPDESAMPLFEPVGYGG